MSQDFSWPRTQHHLAEGQVRSQAAGPEALEGQIWTGSFSSKCHLVPEWALGEVWTPAVAAVLVPVQATLNMLSPWEPLLAVRSCSDAVLCPTPSRTIEHSSCSSAPDLVWTCSQSKQGHFAGLAQADTNAGLSTGNLLDFMQNSSLLSLPSSWNGQACLRSSGVGVWVSYHPPGSPSDFLISYVDWSPSAGLQGWAAEYMALTAHSSGRILNLWNTPPLLCPLPGSQVSTW